MTNGAGTSSKPSESGNPIREDANKYFEQGKKFSSELSGDYLDRDEELITGRNPLAALIEPTTGYNAVNMWMEHEVLPPCMKH